MPCGGYKDCDICVRTGGFYGLSHLSFGIGNETNGNLVLARQLDVRSCGPLVVHPSLPGPQFAHRQEHTTTVPHRARVKRFTLIHVAL